MALATQCPHCFTIFRVASDQLKLRGGLVRCGSCKQVFNGNDYLVEASVSDGHYQPVPGSKAQAAATTAPEADIPVPAAPPPPATAAPAPPAPPAPLPAVAGPNVFRSPDNPGYIPDLSLPLRAAEQDEEHFPLPLTPSHADREAEPHDAVAGATPDAVPRDDNPAGHADENPFAAYERAAGAAAAGEDIHSLGETGANAEPEPEEAGDAADQDAEAPAFVKKAERKERRGHFLQMAMMVLAGVMVPVLLLQSAYYWRNQLAAAVPPLQPMLNGMCAAFHCTVGLPAEIDRLSLESNELQVVPPNQNIYALSLVLRNRGATPQAWPYIELTLNNDDEKPVVRRVFRPLEYLPKQQQIDSGIAGESEQQVKLTFELNDALVSGYRIYLFYP